MIDRPDATQLLEAMALFSWTGLSQVLILAQMK